VLRAFSEANGHPTAELLREFITRYPRYAKDLTDFALAWYLDHGEEVEDLSGVPDDEAMVERAMSNLQDLLFQLDKKTGNQTGLKEEPMAVPFVGFAPDDYVVLWGKLGLGPLLGAKLVRRLVEVPERLLSAIAKELRGQPQDLRAYFLGPPLLMGENYRAESKPEIARGKESFEKAVAAEKLPEEQKQALMAKYG
jgi:hypothetical protein